MFEIIDKEPNGTVIKVVGVGGAAGRSGHITRGQTHAGTQAMSLARVTLVLLAPVLLLAACASDPSQGYWIAPDGSLLEPKTRWGGIMRDSPFKNFERANVEFIEFWLLDPFITNKTNSGELYLQLGNVSEDVLKDGRQFYENALLQTVNLDETNWGVVSKTRPVTFAFDNNSSVRETQDVGFDGLNDSTEVVKFGDFLGNVNAILNPDAYATLLADPSSDNFRHFRDSYYDTPPINSITDRYKDFNGPGGNSPAQAETNGFTN